MYKNHKFRLGATAALASLALLAAGCGSSGSSTTSSTTGTSTASSSFCDVFKSISATTSAGSQPTTKAEWDQRIKVTKELTAAAPSSLRSEADTYMRLVVARRDLMAANGYVPFTDLSKDVRNNFISEHSADQAEANKLIQYAKDNCPTG